MAWSRRNRASTRITSYHLPLASYRSPYTIVTFTTTIYIAIVILVILTIHRW